MIIPRKKYAGITLTLPQHLENKLRASGELGTYEFPYKSDNKWRKELKIEWNKLLINNEFNTVILGRKGHILT